VQPDSRRTWAVEKERGCCFDYVVAQFVSVIPFGEDVLSQALSAIASVSFLDNFKSQLRHTFMIWHHNNRFGMRSRHPFVRRGKSPKRK
jgi:hypothetical protein